MTLQHFTIADLQRALHDGELSAREIARQTLDDIARVNPQINAWTEVTAQRMLAEADSIDALRREKRPPAAAGRHSLRGENLFDVAGHTTLAGAELLSDRPPAACDSWAVRQLHSAGALLSGMLNMDAYAYGFTTENSYYGATRNPHDLSRIAGGSSGGSAAAVAAGLVHFSLGSDTNGSIRVPASAVRDLWPETHFRAPVALWQPSVCRQSGSYWSFCPPGGRPRRGV
ncbi:putative amidase [Klebsiella pneumoniae]|uniref:Putative amidase n=1 Tax=Klebsiella pneumoniae TaxID=573 RepID=A0A377TSU2_KLEPN|nr:putative amidase [Klebsiella pneumoniae]